MSSNDIAIHVEGVSKRYEIYGTPRDRLKQFILPRMQRFFGQEPKKYYREFWALKDISFEVKKGESVGIVGRNGSGKSTLLQIVTGILTPTFGSISTVGRIAALLELGSGFNPEFTGRENVYLNGSLLGLSIEEIDAKFEDIASFADIGEYLDQPVKTYSSGMLVRVAFAVQVQVEPDILIIDEALAVGDALFQKRCLQRLEKLISDGVTLLFVSHDQESVRTLTNRAMLLNRGHAAAWGLSSEVILAYRRHLHEEESAYFSALTEKVSKAKLAKDSMEKKASCTGDHSTALKDDKHYSANYARTARMSFGDGGIKVTQVQTFDASGEPCTIFYIGDRLRVRVDCVSDIDTDRLNVAIRIRNKEGVKIYSWGTLNQDMQVLAGIKKAPIFWQRRICAGEHFEVWLEFDCAIGVNLYEIQAAVSYEEKPDYSAQRILHWIDEAAFFQVLMKRKEYFFGGIIDLKMEATWNCNG